MTTPFEDDLAALAEVGAAPLEADELARLGFAPGMFSTHVAMGDEVAQMAARLDEPSPFDQLPPGFMDFPELD